MDSPPLFMRVSAARSSACAWFSVVSTPKITGTPLAQARVHEAARALAGHVLEMRRVAANHAAERDHRVVLAAGRELERRQRQLEGAGRAQHDQLVGAAAVRAPGARGALDQLVDERGIEARRDDGHATAARIEAALAGSSGSAHGRRKYIEVATPHSAT